MRKRGNATVRPQMVGYQQGAPKRNAGYKQPEPHYTAEEMRRQLKAGVLIGFIAAALVFGAILWLWVLPTMEGAVHQAQEAVATASGQAVFRA